MIFEFFLPKDVRFSLFARDVRIFYPQDVRFPTFHQDVRFQDYRTQDYLRFDELRVSQPYLSCFEGSIFLKS